MKNNRGICCFLIVALSLFWMTHLSAQHVQWTHTGKWLKSSDQYAIDDSNNTVISFNHYYRNAITLFDRTIGPFVYSGNSGLVKTRPDGSTEWNLVFTTDTLTSINDLFEFASVISDGKNYYATVLGAGKITIRRNNVVQQTMDVRKSVSNVLYLMKISSDGKIVWMRAISNWGNVRNQNNFNVNDLFFHKETQRIVLLFNNWDSMLVQTSKTNFVKRLANHSQNSKDCSSPTNSQCGILVYDTSGVLRKERHLPGDLYLGADFNDRMCFPKYVALTHCDTASLDGMVLNPHTITGLSLDSNYQFHKTHEIPTANGSVNWGLKFYGNQQLSFALQGFFQSMGLLEDTLIIPAQSATYKLDRFEAVSFGENYQLIRRKKVFHFKSTDTVWAQFQYGSIHDQFLYLTGYLVSSSVKPVDFAVNGRTFQIPGVTYQNINQTMGFVMKLDTLLNVVWADFTPGNSMLHLSVSNDHEGNLYLPAYYYTSNSLPFLDTSIVNKGNEFNCFLKINNVDLKLGKVGEGPYCAGDSIDIPFVLKGDFKPGNQIIAELSDEHGSFDSLQKVRRLGVVNTQTDSVIKGRLPQTRLYSSSGYKIRLVSTQPYATSYYQIDTLRLLIYSKDTLDAGPAVTICRGDTVELNVHGGTGWRWSNYNVRDTTFRTTKAWPVQSYRYRIIVNDTSGCGQTDTGYKQVNVISLPHANLGGKDTTLCFMSTIDIKAKFSGGVVANYHWKWYDINKYKMWNLQGSGSGKTSDLFNYYVPGYITDSIDVVLVLGDGCSNIDDTSLYRIRVEPKAPEVKLTPQDTAICPGGSLTAMAKIEGGHGASYYAWDWLEQNANGSYKRLEHDSGKLTDTRVVQLPVNAKDPQKYALVLKDYCSTQRDTAYVTLRPVAKLKIEKIKDTFLCRGTRQVWRAKGKGGQALYQWKWMSEGKVLSLTDSLVWVAGDSLHVQLILSDACLPQGDTISFKVGVPAVLKSDIWTGSHQAVDTVICGNTPLKLYAVDTSVNQVITWYVDERNVSSADTFYFDPKAPLFLSVLKYQIKLKVMDVCNTQGDSSVISLEVYPQLKLTVNKVDSICFGSEVLMLASGQGGQQPYSYQWSDTQGVVLSIKDSLLISHKDATRSGVYQLRLALRDACMDLDTAISQSVLLAPLQLRLNLLDSCSTTAVKLNANIKGGKPWAYRMSWWQGSDRLAGTENPLLTLPGVGGTNYRALVNDGCSEASDTVSIRAAQRSVMDLSADGFCLNELTRLKVSASGVSRFEWWSDGEALSDQDSAAEILYASPGLHKVMVSVKGVMCFSSDTLVFSVVKKPLAWFEFAPVAGSSQPLMFRFTNLSQNGNSWLWDFGQGGQSDQKSPDYAFTNTGLYKIMLVAGNNNLCFDTLIRDMQVEHQLDFFFPNSFSPDGNGINDVFGLNPNQYNLVKTFHLEVYNRWGEKVFQTDDMHEAWTGGTCQQGMYLYKAVIRDVYNLQHKNLEGMVELLR